MSAHLFTVVLIN